MIESDKPITCELKASGFKYCLAEKGHVELGVELRPSQITVNDEITKFRHDANRKTIMVTLPTGEGTVVYK